LQEQKLWGTTEKFLFRIAFIFFPLFVVIYLFDLELFQGTISWFAKYIWQIQSEVLRRTSGSGDTLYHYVAILTIVSIALFGTIIWSVMERKRNDYSELHYWLRVLVRYSLALVLFQYGIFKIFKSQFPFPELDTLTRSYGDSSPMNLAWNFFGFSKGYNMFIGIAELCGLLLLFRRTVTLGALIAFATTVNIMAVNYFYDVPVKILSTALVVMSLFLLAPNLERLWCFFVTNTTSSLIVFRSAKMKKKWLIYSLNGVKVLILGFFMISAIKEAREHELKIGDDRLKAPLYGIYDVETFIINQDTLPPLSTNSLRWKQLIISWPQNVCIRFMNDSAYYFNSHTDTLKKKFTIEYEGESILNYSLPDELHMVFEGKLSSDSVYIVFAKRDVSRILLKSRRFRWISDKPFNR